MRAPDPARSNGLPLERGTGHLAFARVDGATALVGCAATTPLQVLAPRRRGPSAWAVLASHGGGLVAGDSIDLRVDVAEHAAAAISTQAETKVYRSPDGALATQRLEVEVGEGGLLALVPAPVSPFGGARYDQRQRFELAPGASLLLVDALVAGRTARGERWAFRLYRSRNEIRVGGRLVFGDALVLEPRGPAELSARLGPFEAFAIAVVLGPALADCARALASAAAGLPVEADAPLLATASPLPGGAVLRCAAATTEALATFVHRAIEPVCAALGDTAFLHRW